MGDSLHGRTASLRWNKSYYRWLRKFCGRSGAPPLSRRSDRNSCHRKEGFRPKRIKPWLLPELENLTKEGKIQVFANFELKEITRGFVLGLKGSEILSINSDFVLLLTGYRQKTGLFEQLGITLINDQPVFDQSTMETNVPNVFVIGTAAVGTEAGGVTTFIENAHVHVKRVLHALNLIERVHAAQTVPLTNERSN